MSSQQAGGGCAHEQLGGGVPGMTRESIIEQLVQEALDNDLTAEEVCAEHPELVCEVLERLRQCKSVEAQLEAIFPSSHGLTSADQREVLRLTTELPQLPGYEIESILGRGGMGIVYKAKHLKLNRPVALKMLLAGRFAARPEITRFKREAEAVAALRHPNVVQIYDVGDFEGRPYFTMEFMDGGTLAAKLAGAPQPGAHAAAVVVALCRAIEAAHQAGIVHRDLKPANILLSADGTPKVGDFGLARNFEGESGLTITGCRVGTPSYMAPEQAIGKASKVGPAADIYSLGAILYEMLTGRPPFRGETATDTERQVILQSPVPPSRLNGKVTRDLETICLKCLAKEPQRRYVNAAALADDLERFQRGEAVIARRPGPVERVCRWIRRRPAFSALIAASVLFTTVVVGDLMRVAIVKAQRRLTIEAQLRQVKLEEEQGHWADAGAALDRAEARLPEGGNSDLHQQLTQVRDDLKLVIELDRIHLKRETRGGDLTYYKTRADEQYLSAFQTSGIAKPGEPIADVSGRLKRSPVRLALIAAVDDWAVCAQDKERRKWLLEIGRASAPDDSGWGDRVRNPAVWDDPAALSELADSVPVKGQPASLLLALGDRLRAIGGEGTAFLQRVQESHPADFWANIALGHALFNSSPSEAAGYYRAALASRPDAAIAYTALGDALRSQRRMEDAFIYYRQALEIDPNYARGHTNLGNYLKDEGRLDEAIASLRRALEIEPNYAWAHLGLANALSDAGLGEEALPHYQRFHATGPSIPHVENIIRSELVRQGRGEEARVGWRKALDLDPPGHDPWFGYAELCLFLGNEDEYRRARQDLIDRFGDTTNPFIAEKTARAILLAPPSATDLRIAVDLVDIAIAAKATAPEWVYRYFLFAKGLAEYRQGHFVSAIELMNGDAGKVLGPCPRLVIGMAEFRRGDEQQSRNTLSEAIGSVDWGLGHVRSHDQWLWHILRREAEATIQPESKTAAANNSSAISSAP